MLCGEFPGVYSDIKKVNFDVQRRTISFNEERDIPRKLYEFISKYTIRKALSYTLQMASGQLSDKETEKAALELTKLYFHFWSENMLFEDFEPYSRLDWGGIENFFTLAAMRRFIKLYRADFNIEKFDSQKMMILISPKGKEKIKDFTVTKDQEIIDKVLEDFTYKPIGKGFFPKSSISDAPLIRTKDGYIIVNPLVLLNNDSGETRLLNYLRKYDNNRHQKIKDKLKERVIPVIEQLFKLKYPEAIVVTNFKLPIPNKRNQSRELDILAIDDSTGFVLYIEVKHFFNPTSYSEMRSVDSQLKEALKKTAGQLEAIRYNWDLIKHRFDVKTNLNRIESIILSHHYVGYDVEVHESVPIVNTQGMFESIGESNSIEELYETSREYDQIYSSIKMTSRNIEFEFAGYKFDLEMEVLDPKFEAMFLRSYRNIIMDSIDFEESKIFNNIEDYSRVLLTKLQNQ
jgi:Holliday junction resolvase-like predicted endonuclease